MQDTPPPNTPAPVPEIASAPVHDALGLTNGGPVAHIALDGQVYVLRITRAGKLILTK
ncbi:hemin uptake protein HemP [Pseudotabrizicola alkalilacus]|uniref:Hemin uptake protein HemP n=1 Tax=Pseudotabrizicola alkalilacus TaxID=2305252 RepID=A0A411Z181_9RHOB|nr:hemin uptake protein HemP [Pseudotabrizicola alkalilacus]RGP36802.1 hemin uptake protein HemP [Pseudotabrizicola alkalilacus]